MGGPHGKEVLRFLVDMAVAMTDLLDEHVEEMRLAAGPQW